MAQAFLRSAKAISFCIILSGALGLAGCGGGGKGSGQPLGQGPGETARGSALVTMYWPEATRLVPAAANSVRIVASKPTGEVIDKHDLVRPESGFGTVSTTFESLPAETVVFTAAAYPNSDATGTPQTRGSVSVQIKPNGSTDVNLTMGTTIARVGITPENPSVSVGATVSLAATAYDSADRIVLTSGTKWQWQLATGSAVGTLTPNADQATFTGTAAGSATVRATETESGKTGQTTASVSAATPVVVTVSPANATLSAGATQQFTATVTGTSNTAVTWSVVDSGGGGITQGGLYTAPGSAGTYHVKAISTADASKSAIATVSVTASDPGYSGEMIYIDAGPFDMGTPDSYTASHGSEEHPQHSVTLSGYYIGKYEVTRGEYRAFMNAGGYTTQSYWSAAGWSWKGSRTEPQYWAASQDFGTGTFTQTDNHPVVGVTYYEAEAFCNWAVGHLPTEAQWEKAARWDGHPRIYPWGDVWDPELCNNWEDDNAAGGGYQKAQTAPVGSYPLGASPYGCQDMAGNVWEWVQDWYSSSYYAEEPPGGWNDPQGPAWTGNRALRRSCWVSNPNDCRCAVRYGYNPTNVYCTNGFRLAR